MLETIRRTRLFYRYPLSYALVLIIPMMVLGLVMNRNRAVNECGIEQIGDAGAWEDIIAIVHAGSSPQLTEMLCNYRLPRSSSTADNEGGLSRPGGTPWWHNEQMFLHSAISGFHSLLRPSCACLIMINVCTVSSA